MTTELISLKKVEKSFLFGSFQDWSLTDLLKSTLGHEKHVVLKDIDLSVRKGECIGIVGEQDSGKTLLMKLISGSSLCTKGLREVNGKVFFLSNSGLQSLHPELTVKENLYFYGSLSYISKIEISDHFEEILNFSQLVGSANRKFKNLSRGEKLKLILSLAVFVSVDIILIDEALPLQDKDFLDKLQFKISEFKKAGKAFIITATSTNPIKGFCDRFLFMKNGRLVEDLSQCQTNTLAHNITSSAD